jgi:hypothetical protein
MVMGFSRSAQALRAQEVKGECGHEQRTRYGSAFFVFAVVLFSLLRLGLSQVARYCVFVRLHDKGTDLKGLPWLGFSEAASCERC